MTMGGSLLATALAALLLGGAAGKRAAEKKFPGPNEAQSIDDLVLGEGELLCNCSLRAPLCGLAESGPLAYVCRTSGGCKATLYRPDPEARPNFVQYEYRCVHDYLWVPKDRPLVCETARHNGYYEQIGCCQSGNFCAAELELSLLPHPPTLFPLWVLPLLLGVLGAVGVVGAFVCFWLSRRRPKLFRRLWPLGKRGRGLLREGGAGGAKAALLETGACSREVRQLTSLLRDAVTSLDETSGSGSGLPLLVQRTVARQIELHEKIGEGRFGTVYAADWKGEPCAVKLFESRDEKSWFREVEIYQSHMLRHPNLLAFFGSDNKDACTHTQLWLITELHPNGSLCDFLRLSAPTMAETLKLSRSLANGLAFLHAENLGTYNKPGIAHRDVKSKNVLVKADGDCAIADLGMAVRYSSGVLDLPDNGKVGTRRYLAPELLEETMPKGEFEAYRRVDVYALGLTLWEIFRRCAYEGPGSEEEASLPFAEWVDSDPSAEEMKALVCVAKRRPSVPNRWASHKLMAGLSRVLKECWSDNPSARLPALRIKKSIDSLSEITDKNYKTLVL